MNKTQAAVAMLLGATLGVGGKQAVDAALGRAEAAGKVPVAHAVDLRRDFGTSAPLRVLAYGNVALPDGGVRDIGRAVKCEPSPAAQTQLAACMNVVAKECVWP